MSPLCTIPTAVQGQLSVFEPNPGVAAGCRPHLPACDLCVLLPCCCAAANPLPHRYHRNADGSGGFVSNLACVTQAGWGYNGRNSYKCEKGTYNGKDTLSDCKVRAWPTAASSSRQRLECLLVRAVPHCRAGRRMCPDSRPAVG